MATYSDAPTYTWDDLLTRIGGPTDEERALYALTTPKAALAEMGRRISSRKVLTDLLRWLGTAFACVRHAPSAVLGVPPELLRVIAQEGAALRSMLASHTTAETTLRSARGVSVAYADGQMELASKRREQLRAALAGALQEDLAQAAALDAAYGTERDHRQLAEALVALVALARVLLADEASPAGKRLARGGVAPAMLTSVEELAAAVVAAGERASAAKGTSEVPQADVDAQDGLCLTRMRHLRDAFEAAHDLDPSVPRLVPIATRSFFSHPRHAAPAPGISGDPTPATPPSAAAG